MSLLPPPLNVRCNGEGPSRGSLSIACNVDPAQADVVSFMVARADDPEGWPFLQYSVKVEEADSDGVVSATLSNLEPGKAYRVMARAHKRPQAFGWYAQWSDVAHGLQPCTAANATAGSEVEEEQREAGPVPTRWLEVYRHNGNSYKIQADNNVTLPDFLQGHNAGDVGGVFGDIQKTMYTPFAQNEMNSSFARYCVELEDKTFSDVVTVVKRFAHPVESKFANYYSCSAGQCSGMYWGDVNAFGPGQETLARLCPGCDEIPASDRNGCKCKGTEAWKNESTKYVGMALWYDDSQWFSFPTDGRCPVGARVGEGGCTWSLAPVSYTVSLGTMEDKYGVFKSADRTKWLEQAELAFLDLGAPACGGAGAAAIDAGAGGEVLVAQQGFPLAQPVAFILILFGSILVLAGIFFSCLHCRRGSARDRDFLSEGSDTE